MIKLQILTLLISVLLINNNANLLGQNKSDTENDRPNIIIIMSDDHTMNAISSYGSKINNTPNIDRLAEEGIRFNKSFVTNSICAPSRAVMLTGKYSHINGLKDNRDNFDNTQITFPKLLQDSGYQTALIGKWHLKTAPVGFDHLKILRGQGSYYNPTFIGTDDTTKYEGYVTNLIADFVLETLNKFDRDKPFCLIYSNKAPHRNWMPDIKHLTMYDDVKIPLPETFFDDYSTRSAAAREQDMEVNNMYNSFDMKIHPADSTLEYSGGKKSYDAQAAWERVYSSMTDKQKIEWDAVYEPKNKAFLEANLSGRELAVWKYQRYIKDYLRCVASVDDNVGRLLDYLDENNLTENTIVIYTSDQGFYLGEHGWYDKRFMYEESFTTPLIIRYPKEIAPGITTDKLVINLDYSPTILDYANIPIPADVQGESLRPLLKGKSPVDWRKSVYYHFYALNAWHDVKKHYGVRTERFKLIHFYDDIDAWEFYDLEKDPNEINNIFGKEEYAEVQVNLEKELIQLRKYYNDVD